MLRSSAALVALAFCVSPAIAGPSYEGIWSESARSCRTDQDGVRRLEINPQGWFWYEERCHGPVRAVSRNSWSADLSCEGEGSKQRLTTRLILPSPNSLVLENAPVTPTKRQSYVRCRGR